MWAASPEAGFAWALPKEDPSKSSAKFVFFDFSENRWVFLASELHAKNLYPVSGIAICFFGIKLGAKKLNLGPSFSDLAS